MTGFTAGRTASPGTESLPRGGPAANLASFPNGSDMIDAPLDSFTACRGIALDESGDDMAWVKPQHGKSVVDAAGRFFTRATYEDASTWSGQQWTEYYDALEVVNNWRASHGYPLNAIQTNLRQTVRRFDPDPLAAQRIKRLISIAWKLKRMPSMRLSQMQDLGGCRAILTNATVARSVCEHYLRHSRTKNRLDSYVDYLDKPKKSGYRGVHIIYRYFSERGGEAYNGLKIEMQIRSRYQHAWATAVETVGAFSGEALKSSIGSEEWLRFFALMGSAIALRERLPPVPDTPSNKQALIDELREAARVLNVRERLVGYRRALRHVTATQAGAFFLLQLDPEAGSLNVTGFERNQIELASTKYEEAEMQIKEKRGRDAVLVSVDSVRALARAYPNYFADTRTFLSLLSQTLVGRSRGIVERPLEFDFTPVETA